MADAVEENVADTPESDSVADTPEETTPSAERLPSPTYIGPVSTDGAAANKNSSTEAVPEPAKVDEASAVDHGDDPTSKSGVVSEESPTQADASTPQVTISENDLVENEMKTIALAEKATSEEELLDAYLKLSSCYRAKSSDVTSPVRRKLGDKLCKLGTALPNLNVLVVTWNVGNAAPIAEQLKHLVPVENKLYDMIVVGLQECDYELTADMGAQATDFYNAWRQEKRTSPVFEKRVSWKPNTHTTNTFFGSFAKRGSTGFEATDDMPHGKRKKTPSCSHFFRGRATAAEHAAKRAITSKAGSHFASLILQHIGNDNYFQVAQCELMQMRQFVFARVEHRPRISFLEYSSQATGIGGVVGNKGGLGVSLRFQHARICFVSCHLAAHRKHALERNRDAAEVLNMLLRKIGTRNVSYLSDWDYVFFTGDLNYRFGYPQQEEEKDQSEEEDPSMMDPTNNGQGKSATEDLPLLPAKRSSEPSLGDLKPSTSVRSPTAELSKAVSNLREKAVELEAMTSSVMTDVGTTITRKPTFSTIKPHKCDCTLTERTEVLSLIQNKSWGQLMSMDQLRKEQENGRALMGFTEAVEYPFPPTFKVARQVDVDYNEKRLPAYCDRILWYVTPSLFPLKDSLVQNELFSPKQVSTSDHKPVCSVFTLSLKREPGHASPSNVPKGVPRKALNLGEFFPKRGRNSRGMQITISELNAENLFPMDYGGSADPYVVAYSTDIFTRDEPGHHPFKGSARTKVQFGSLKCAWDDVLLVRCPAIIATPEDLLDKSLTLSVWDFDTFSMDDHMGEVVLSLEGIVKAFSESSAFYMDKFQGDSERPISQFSGEQEDSDGNESPRNKKKATMYQQSFSNGRTVTIGEKQLAFCLPVIRCGKEAGVLSGKIQLHSPEERIKAVRLSSFGFNWKCTAYMEHRQTKKRPARYPTSQQTFEEGSQLDTGA